jgi:CubicO group peptidase (beta-lactamase class C family)
MAGMPSRRIFLPLLAAQLLLGCAGSQTIAERFARMPPVDDVVTSTAWYRPTVVVHGAPQAKRSDRAVPQNLPPEPKWSAAIDVAIRYESGSVVVRQHDRLVAEWHDAAGGPARRYDSQSMHRGLLALVVGAALADGSLASPATPIATYIPEWRDDPRGRITVEDLLYGRSGFVDPAFALKIDNPALSLFIGEDIRSSILAQQPTGNAMPGRGGVIDTQLLGLVLERATRKPYARYLSEQIWQGIGAGDAYVRLDHPGGSTRTMCCLQASARDWALVGQLVLDQGRARGRQLLPAEWVARLRTPNPLQPNTSMYWFVKPTPLAPREFGRDKLPATPTPFARPDVFYAGGRGGIRVYVIPSLDAVVVRLGKLRYDFDDGQFLNPFLEALAK